MRWYKHDTNANQDVKLKKLRMKYGLEGYGLYWYCLELICDKVSEDNITFELEHDSEIISHDTGIHYERVQEMMSYMVKLNLFEMNGGIVTCMKIAKRLDKSMSSSPKFRLLLDKIKINHDEVMTESASIMQDKTRLEQTRLEQTKAPPIPPRGEAKQKKRKSILSDDFLLTQNRASAAYDYWLTKGRKDLMSTEEFDRFTAHHKAHGSTMLDWDAAWRTWYMNAVKFNRPGGGNGQHKQPGRPVCEVDRIRAINAERAAEREKAIQSGRGVVDPGGDFLGADGRPVHPSLDT